MQFVRRLYVDKLLNGNTRGEELRGSKEIFRPVTMAVKQREREREREDVCESFVSVSPKARASIPGPTDV